MPCVQSYEARCLRLGLQRDSSGFTRHYQRQQPCLRCRTKWGSARAAGAEDSYSYIDTLDETPQQETGWDSQAVAPSMYVTGRKTMEHCLRWSFSK